MIMKKLNKYILVLLAFVAFIPACKDEDLVILPDWESGVHAFAEVSDGSASNFLKGDPSVDLSFDMLWNSIDGENTVTKIELFVRFNEAYIDQDGNPRTASHGGSAGLPVLTLEGAAVPADKTPTSFSISQAAIFDVYNGATFDYYGDGNALPVWGAGSISPTRNTTNNIFTEFDTFQVRWTLTTADGRVFDSWSPSVCTEFPGANCSVAWATVCSQVINEPAQDYTIVMNDSYGDGWNGAAIRVVVDGVATDYTIASGSTGTQVVTVPAGTSTLSFEFVSGDWDSEVTFTITSAKGNVIASGGPSPGAGVLTLNLCNENS